MYLLFFNLLDDREQLKPLNKIMEAIRMNVDSIIGHVS